MIDPYKLLNDLDKTAEQKNIIEGDPTEEIETLPPTEPAPPEVPVLQVSSPIKLSNIFRHPQAHPIALDMLLLKKYGPDFLLWEPETLEHRIPVDFKIDSLSDLNMAKIQALKTLHMVDTYWERWEVFNWCTMAFNSIFPDFEIMQVPTATQCLISCDISSRIRTDVKFNSEVVEFITASFKYDGVLQPFAPCDFVKLDLGPYYINPEEVVAKWPQVRDSKKVPEGDTAENEQLRRMLVAHELLQHSRALLREQLRVVADAK